MNPASELLENRNRAVGTVLASDRAAAYVSILASLLTFRRGHELELLPEDVVAAVGIFFEAGLARLAASGVTVNPYTAHAIAFLPFAFRMEERRYDFPRDLFEVGQAAVLPWETVRLMESVEVNVCDEIVTSENAAPFYRYVKAGIPAVYTGGHPNASVKRLLSLLSQAGVRAVLAGHPAFPYAEELRATLAAGWVEQETFPIERMEDHG